MKKTIEFKLKISRSNEVKLLKLLDRGKNIYNLALSECKRRLNRIRADIEYRNLLSERMEFKQAKEPTADIDRRLNSIVKGRYGLNPSDLEKFVKENINYLSEGFNSQFSQVLADRAVEATYKVLYGKSKNTRFKGKWDNLLVSLNSKSSDTGLMFDPDSVSITYGTGKKKLILPLCLNYRNDYDYHKWYLNQIIDNCNTHDRKDINYIRLVRRTAKGHNLFYAHFVIDVRPYGMKQTEIDAENALIEKETNEKKAKAEKEGRNISRMRFEHPVSSIREYFKTSRIIEQIHELNLYKQFKVCFDMGPKNMAVFLKSEDHSIALLQPIFDKLVEYDKEIRRHQRKMDRSRRTTNPEAFNSDRTIKKGVRIKVRSKSYIETRDQVKELKRLVKETRKTALNELANILEALGCSFKAEKIKYKNWQSGYGKSVGSFSPSYFIKNVFSKAEKAGDEAMELPLRNALSQMCVCKLKRKKKLSERTHSCECGCTSQRDVISAYLGLYCSPDIGDWDSISMEFQQADRQLLEASHHIYKSQTASRRSSSFALRLDKNRRSCSCPDGNVHGNEAGTDVLVYKDLKHLIGEFSLGMESHA